MMFSKQLLISVIASIVISAIRGARQMKQDVEMAKISGKSGLSATPPNAQPPGLSEMRATYKMARDEIREQDIRVSQSISDHWCSDFNLPEVPFSCTCWRFEYMAFFCVDWTCTNGHTSDFAMCQFLKVSWPIDPPRRSTKDNDTATESRIQSTLKMLEDFIGGKKKQRPAQKPAVSGR